MENFRYCSPTKYIFGRDMEKETGKEAAAIGAKKVLIVYGGGSAVRSGLLDRVCESLRNSSIEFVSLGGVQPNPVDGAVRKGIEICRSESDDTIIAVGGGSVIDTAKAIALGVPYSGDFWDFYSGKAIAKEALPVGVVLTIPAAGSEGSGNSVITLESEKIKISLRTDFVLRPKFAIMNPELTVTLPAYQTASGIADMMAHIMERYFTPTENVEITDRVSEGILKAIIEEAPKVMSNPQDYQARANIMWSGTLAHNGICGTGRKEDWASHAIEHEISAMYNVTHGAGLAVIFPAWMTFMAKRNPGKIAQYARRVFDVKETNDEAAALEGIDCLKAFFGSIGLPVTFAELGIANPDISEMVRRLHINKGEVIGGYLPLRAADTTEIYRLAL